MSENNRVIRVNGTIEPMVEKLASLEREVSSERGEFSLFGLFLREDAPDRWDLVVSAPWLEANQRDGMRYLADKLKLFLDAKERLMLSRVVILEEDNPGMAAVQKAFSTRHNSVEVQDSVLFGLQIRHAYIITSSDTGRAAS